MKKIFITLTLCIISIVSYAEFVDLNNGWRQYSENTVLNNNTKNGWYFVKLNDSTEFSIYIDIYMGDTLCELRIVNKDTNGNPKIFYSYDQKATYYFNAFVNNETTRFAAISFNYDDKNNFSSGFSPEGLGNNDLAKQIAFKLLEGYSVRLVAFPRLAEYQEIKELVIPSIK